MELTCFTISKAFGQQQCLVCSFCVLKIANSNQMKAVNERKIISINQFTPGNIYVEFDIHSYINKSILVQIVLLVFSSTSNPFFDIFHLFSQSLLSID